MNLTHVASDGTEVALYEARVRAWAGPLPLPWHVRRQVVSVTRPDHPPIITVETWWARTAYLLGL